MLSAWQCRQPSLGREGYVARPAASRSPDAAPASVPADSTHDRHGWPHTVWQQLQNQERRKENERNKGEKKREHEHHPLPVKQSAESAVIRGLAQLAHTLRHPHWRSSPHSFLPLFYFQLCPRCRRNSSADRQAAAQAPRAARAVDQRPSENKAVRPLMRTDRANGGTSNILTRLHEADIGV